MKKLTKKFLCIVVSFSFLINLSYSRAFAKSSNISDLKSEILNLIQCNNFSSEQEIIKLTIEKILDAKCKTEYGISDYNFSELLAYENDNSNFRNLNFWEEYIKFQHDFRVALKLQIENLSAVYTYDKFDLENDIAKVTISQELTFNSVGIKGCTKEKNTYSFTLKKKDNLWKIKEFSSSDLYFEMYYPKTLQRSFSFEQLTQDYITPQEEIEANFLSDTFNAVDAGLYKVDELNVYNYAVMFALDYNTGFPTYPGVDCQNFASQCLWFGFNCELFKPESISRFAFDNSGKYKWYCKNENEVTHSWISCSNFRNYLKNNTNSNEYGLHGIVYDKMTSSSLSSAKCGDIVYTNDGGHAMSITNAPFPQLGDTRTRNVNTLCVSAHTNNVRNKQLALICGNNLSSCMLAHITGFKR